MNGPRAAVGLSLLCALVFCALAAPSAMAVKGTTAFTCKPIAKAATFADEHCTEGVDFGEGFAHEEIPVDKILDATATNVGTEKKAIPAKFKTAIAGIAVELEAESFHSCKETSVANLVDEKKQMVIAGDYCGEFTNVVVTKPAGKCTVTGKAVKLEEGFYEGRVVLDKITKEEEMYFEFRPPEGEVFAEFKMEGIACPFKNMKFEVNGLVADANPMTEEFPLDGATLNFTTEDTETHLEVGGVPAAFEGTFTPYAPGGEQNPFVATTTKS